MAEGESRYTPPEAEVKPSTEKKGSFRDKFKNIIKNWPSRVAIYRKLGEMSGRVREETEEHRDNPPETPTSQTPTEIPDQEAQDREPQRPNEEAAIRFGELPAQPQTERQAQEPQLSHPRRRWSEPDSVGLL